MIINSDKYFNNKIKWKKDYKICVIKTKEDIKNMMDYFKKFKKRNDERVASLDFEFNARDGKKLIALFQICLESTSDKAVIFIFYPPDLNKQETNILKSLLIDKNIKKILHGAESLDMPYLFNNLFRTKKSREEFLTNVIDTRYLCEYYHIERNSTNKCKIYLILREMEVINDKQLEFLQKNEEKMGPIYLIWLDVRKLSKSVVLYSAFDTVYLNALVKQFPDNYIYNKIVPELTRFSYLDKYDKLFFEKVNEETNVINNNFIRQNENIKMIELFYSFINMINDKKGIFQNLLKINYFKRFLEVYIKYFVYKNVLENKCIWKSNEEKIDKNQVKKLKSLNSNFNKVNKYMKNVYLYVLNDVSKQIKKELV